MDKYTILVVDDIKENIDVLVGTLKKEYKVIFATSGQKALDIVKTQSIDLILLDIMMPQMDGFEVCKQLKKTKETAEIPIIFVTADHEVIDEAK
ncbi:MAG: response regulator, partial [Tissierellales bacterium]|nr:response regulator [Tissierellales bacterium]